MKTAVEVEGLHKTFDIGFLGALPGMGGLAAKLQMKGIAQRVHAVRGVSFSVEPGEIFGFLGPNGAGKTTTMKMLMGLIHPTAGTGTLLGEPLGNREVRRRLGFLPEHPYFYEYLKPMEFLDFYGRLFSMTAQERKQRSEQLLDRVGLGHALDRPLRKFSKGMVQRVGLAQALLNDPDLVVLDEPMSGLDPMGRKDVRDLIYELKQRGKTVFFSSHILQDVEMICDRVAIVVQGQVRSIGPLHEMLDAKTDRVDVVLGGVSDALHTSLSEVAPVREAAGKRSYSVPEESQVTAFVAQAIEGGAQVLSVVPHRPSLEEIFVAEAGRPEAP